MKETLNTAGYDLSEIESGKWAFNVRRGPIVTGSFKEVIKHAIAVYGFHPDDLDEAVQQMVQNGHDSAHFGMYKTMIFTFNRSDKRVA